MILTSWHSGNLPIRWARGRPMCRPTVFFILSFSLVFKENSEVVVFGARISNPDNKHVVWETQSLHVNWGLIYHYLVPPTHFYTLAYTSLWLCASILCRSVDGAKEHYCSVSATWALWFFYNQIVTSVATWSETLDWMVLSEFLPLLEPLEALWDCEEWSRMACVLTPHQWPNGQGRAHFVLKLNLLCGPWTLSSWNLTSLPPNQFSIQREFKVMVLVVVVSRRPSRGISISIASLTPTSLPLPWLEENINVANSQPRDCLAPSKYILRDLFMKMVVTGTVNWGRLCKGAHET